MRKLILATVLVLLAPIPAVGQGPDGPPCGELELAEFYLDYQARYFTEEDLKPVRDSVGIERLTPSFARRVVDERKECGRVMGQLMSRMARTGELQRIRPGGFDFSVFRYGPYYAVLVIDRAPRPSGEGFSTGYGVTYIFEADDLMFVGSIAG